MMKNRVKNETEAFLYITECLLATVSAMAMKKSRKKYEYQRHIAIAQSAINWIVGFNITPEKGKAIEEVLMFPVGGVEEWAKQYEV